MDSSPDSSNHDNSLKKSPFDELSRDELISKCKGLLTIAQKAKQAKYDMQNELENYKTQLGKCESEKQLSQENLNILQELVDSLTEQKLNFITEIDTAQGKIKSLLVQCQNYEGEIEKHKAEVIIWDQKSSEVTQKLSDLDSEIISLKRQNNRLVEENEQLINQLTEIEAQTAELNNISLQQRKQLQILEENVQRDEDYKNTIEELRSQIKEMENKLESEEGHSEKENQIIDYETKMKEMVKLYETERARKESLHIKLRCYKEKIVECANCINLLQNSRLILFKTVTEYAKTIPKWQNDLSNASKALQERVNIIKEENSALKIQILELQQQLDEVKETNKELNQEETSCNTTEIIKQNEILSTELSKIQQQYNSILSVNTQLKEELVEINYKYNELIDSQFPIQIHKNNLLKEQISEHEQKIKELTLTNIELTKSVENLNHENKKMTDSLSNQLQENESIRNLHLQIKALESEKSILVKEKLSARDSVLELENRNQELTQQVGNMKSEIQTIKAQLDTITQEKLVLETNHKIEKEGEVNVLKCEIMALQEQYDLLKKEHEDLQDLNGLLKEEVETLKFSLEQPKDDSDNLSDLNVSLQTDIVKLENKLSAYKQENSSLLAELKESRIKVKEFDKLVAEYEEAKSKLSSYKTENSELLNEMKEINQVLKERGESISKLQKAISEMERLVETLEKDRDSVSQEKGELNKKIEALENEIKKYVENGDVINEVTAERDNAVKLLTERDNLIISLKDEIEKLKQHSLSAELPNEDMSSSTISKAEDYSRMKDLDETFEEKYTKLRIFALKLKNKLNETTTLLQNTTQDKTKLEKLLNESVVADKSITPIAKQEADNYNEEHQVYKSKEEISKLQNKIKILTATVEAAENNMAELERVKAELSCKIQELASEVEAHKVTKETLEKARREVKKKSVLSLEMEDYERSMKELTAKMEEKKKKMVQMESTIDTQEGTIIAMKTQIKLLEEQIKTEETQNRLLKEELQHVTEEGKDKDNLIHMKNGIITKLEQDLEDEKRKNEESDLELTSLLSEKEKVIMALGDDKAELNNKVKRLEFKCAELNEKLKITNIELADLKTEYTSYKVRAQAVLRQNQTVDHSQEEQLKEDVAALKSQVETLTSKLTSAQEQCSELNSEAESLRRRAGEAAQEAARAQQRTARLYSDLTRVAQQYESDRTQHNVQISTLTQCYKTQISELEAKLTKETELLKKQLLAAQESAKSGKASAVLDESNHQYMLPVIPKDDGSDGEMDINVSMIPREEGEGSESAPSPPPTKAYLTSAGSGRSPVPLERLLEEGVPDDEALDTASLGLTPDQEIADLKRRLQAQQQRVKHVTVLLAESERECARMAQLSELLKAELRRVRGATHHAHNTEYMKNVTLKFLTLPPGDERSRLVPVLQKILTLTPDETQKIHSIAKGLDPNPSKGWGSYLPWPGGSK